MPKMKTKSSCKKRFRVTATGKIIRTMAGKQHGMIKRSTRFNRQHGGTTIMKECDAQFVRKMMPYSF